MDLDTLILLIVLSPVILIFGILILYYVRKRFPRRPTDNLNMDIVSCRTAKNGDVHISPRWNFVVLGFVAGAVMVALGVIVAISDIGQPLDFNSACLQPLISLVLLAFGLSVLVYGGRGLTLPSVTVSAANQTVTIRRPGQLMKKDFPISQITRMSSAPFGRLWSFITGISVWLMGLAGALGGHAEAATNSGFGDSINVVRLDLQLADGQSVLLTVIPENMLNDFRRLVSGVLPMI